MQYYKDELRGKKILCPCDDLQSNFYYYFVNNWDKIQPEELIAVEYVKTGHARYRTVTKKNGKLEIKETTLYENGDFRSKEGLAFMDWADVIVTNPPFSLVRYFMDEVLKRNKKFLLIVNHAVVRYVTPTNLFEKFKSNEIRVGVTTPKMFYCQEDETVVNFGFSIWITNIYIPELDNKHVESTFTLDDGGGYEHYDNVDGIEVPKVAMIPKDYYGNMGVPISFISKYNPSQFEIIDLLVDKNGATEVSGVKKYIRLLIRRKR